MKKNDMKKWALLALLSAVLLPASPAALAQAADSGQNAAAPGPKAQDAAKKDSDASAAQDTTYNRSSSADSNDPWYANNEGAYTVSLGTGQLISLSPQPRTDQSI